MIFLEPCSNKQLKVVFIRIILLKRFILRGVLVFCVKTAYEILPLVIYTILL